MAKAWEIIDNWKAANASVIGAEKQLIVEMTDLQKAKEEFVALLRFGPVIEDRTLYRLAEGNRIEEEKVRHTFDIDAQKPPFIPHEDTCMCIECVPVEKTKGDDDEHTTKRTAEVEEVHQGQRS